MPSDDFADAPLAHEKALRDGMWRGHGGFEIALSPVILAGIGWWLDGVFSTSPAFIIAGAVLGFIGACANQYYRYKAAMAVETEARLAGRPGDAIAEATTSRRFGRIEEPDYDVSVDFTEDRVTT